MRGLSIGVIGIIGVIVVIVMAIAAFINNRVLLGSVHLGIARMML